MLRGDESPEEIYNFCRKKRTNSDLINVQITDFSINVKKVPDRRNIKLRKESVDAKKN